MYTVGVALYNNTQIQLELQEFCLPLTRAWMWCAHYVQVRIKRRTPVSYRYSCIAPMYIRIVCMLILLKMLATNQCDIHS